tara:strand:+ start:142 stop:1005 length:864 start_codon:yes stop_codon:yes gene_type:complete
MKLKMIDAFSGIGGFSYAAEKLVGGFETTQFIEINPFCQKILNKHWSHVPIHDDITTFTAKSGEFDIITGGFPCQDLSQAGNRKGISETTRSGLWFELIRTIRMVRPKYFILENVSAILANGMDIVLRDIFETGLYECEWCCIPSSFVGACHQRDRWFLLGFARSIRTSDVTNSNNNGSSSSKKLRVNGKTNTSTQKGQNQTCQSERSSESRNSTTIQSTTKWRDTKHKLNPKWRGWGIKPTIRRANDGVSSRIYRNPRIKALGNSVVPQVAAIPLQRVLDLQKNYG